MAALTTADGLVDAIANRSEIFEFWKANTHTIVAGQFTSTWLTPGLPCKGVAPGAAAVPTKATAGSLCNFTNPGGGEFGHLTSCDIIMDTGGQASCLLYDRLSHMSGLSGLLATSQTVNTAAITRGDTNGVGVQGFVECYGALGSLSQTMTVIYTNSVGTGSRSTTVTIPADYAAGRLLPIPLLTGDFGIKSVESVQIGISTGAAGDFGVTLARRICMVVGRASMLRSGIDLGLLKIETNACLWLVCISTTGSIDPVYGSVSLLTTG